MGERDGRGPRCFVRPAGKRLFIHFRFPRKPLSRPLPPRFWFPVSISPFSSFSLCLSLFFFWFLCVSPCLFVYSLSISLFSWFSLCLSLFFFWFLCASPCLFVYSVSISPFSWFSLCRSLFFLGFLSVYLSFSFGFSVSLLVLSVYLSFFLVFSRLLSNSLVLLKFLCLTPIPF